RIFRHHSAQKSKIPQAVPARPLRRSCPMFSCLIHGCSPTTCRNACILRCLGSRLLRLCTRFKRRVPCSRPMRERGLVIMSLFRAVRTIVNQVGVLRVVGRNSRTRVIAHHPGNNSRRCWQCMHLAARYSGSMLSCTPVKTPTKTPWGHGETCLCHHPAIGALNRRLGAGLSPRGFISALGASLASPRLAEAQAAPSSIQFRNVRLFDGRSGALRMGVSVLVEGNRIKAVAEGGPAAPDGARVIEGDGRVLMPGLIDAHWH